MVNHPSGEPEEAAALRLSNQFGRLVDICSRPPVVFEDLLSHVTSRSHALIVLLLSMPFLLPLPIPGLSTLFGLLIILAAVRIFLRLPPWMPDRFRKRPVPHVMFGRIFARAERLMRKFETHIRPRGLNWVRRPTTRALVCLMIIINGLLLALPLPPGTNFPPALPCVLLSIGLIEEDGAFIAAGLGVSALVIALFATVPIIGWQATKAMLAL